MSLAYISTSGLRNNLEIVTKLASLQANRTDTYAGPEIQKFYQQDPSCWFIIVEPPLTQMRITNEKTKAHALIEQLGPHIVAHVEDIVNHQPPDSCSQIKSRLITIYSISNEIRPRQLLKGEVVNEVKPSLLLNQLRSLNNNACSDDVLKTIFLEQLPGSIKAIFAMSEVSDLSTLVILADKVCKACNASGVWTFAIAPHSSATPTAANVCATFISKSSMDSLAAVVTQLSKRVETRSKKLTQSEYQRGQRNKSNSRGNPSARNGSQSFDKIKYDLCYYHLRHC